MIIPRVSGYRSARCVTVSRWFRPVDFKQRRRLVPFAAPWSALQAKLAAGTTIPNWTAAKGFLGDSFTVTGVTTKPR